jgi:phytanoyl-CoA hydroxylase
MQQEGPLNEEQMLFWNENGYLVLPALVSQASMDSMRQRAFDIMKNVDTSTISVFATDSKQVKTTDQYFLDSATEVRCFFEDGAIAADGSLTRAPELCINKIGHALHEKEPVFEQVTSVNVVACFLLSFCFICWSLICHVIL